MDQWIRVPLGSVGWLCVCVVLSGCLAPLKKVKAPVKVPGAFRHQGTLVLPAKWWKGFGDRQLSSLIEKGLKGNLDIRIAEARLKQRLAIAKKAGASMYPSVSFNGSGGGGANQVGSLFTVTAGLVANYELDVWGRVRSGKDAARLDALASQEALKAASISLSGEVAIVWYQLVERYGQVALIKKQMQTNKRSLSLLQSRFRLGQSTAPDILQQQQLIEAQRGELARVTFQAEVLAHQLAVLLGRAPGQMAIPKIEQFASLPALPRTGLPSALVRRRPDIRSAYLSVLASHRRVGVAIADQFPRITLSGNAQFTPRWQNGFYIQNWLANLVAGLTAPLFDGGLRKAEVERTKAAAKEALHMYGKVILQAFQEVENALVRERGQHKLIASLKRQLALARKVVERTQFRYLNGANNFLRVLDALRSLQALERTHLTAQRDLWLYRVALCRALAGGWSSSGSLSNPTKTKKAQVDG